MEIQKFHRGNCFARDLQPELSAFFENNYPDDIFTPEEKEEDVQDFAAFEENLNSGQIIYLARDVQRRIAGVLSSRHYEITIPRIDENKILQTHFLEWIITESRGAKVASRLYNSFNQDSQGMAKRARRMGHYAAELLYVYPHNPAQQVFRHWGFMDAPSYLKSSRGISLVKIL
jgi:GNAT superfamily N-acetyltransferase